MDAGRIVQLDTPEMLYQSPAYAFVARFVGFENLMPLAVSGRQGDGVKAYGPGGVAADAPRPPISAGARPVHPLGTRADGLAIADPGRAAFRRRWACGPIRPSVSV